MRSSNLFLSVGKDDIKNILNNSNNHINIYNEIDDIIKNYKELITQVKKYVEVNKYIFITRLMVKSIQVVICTYLV